MQRPYSQPQEHDLLEQMIEGVRENFREIESSEDVFKKAKLTADAGFHTEANMKMLSEEGIDGYVADILWIPGLLKETVIKSDTVRRERNGRAVPVFLKHPSLRLMKRCGLPSALLENGCIVTAEM